jgi:hypothetical protein
MKQTELHRLDQLRMQPLDEAEQLDTEERSGRHTGSVPARRTRHQTGFTQRLREVRGGARLGKPPTLARKRIGPRPAKPEEKPAKVDDETTPKRRRGG